MVTKLYLDIETLPADETLKSEIIPLITVRRGSAKRKKDDKILNAAEIEEKFRDTALNGNFGRILCIAYCKEPPENNPVEILKGDEKLILKSFWEIAADVSLFIGHNIMEFDLKFIYKRSVIHNIRPSQNLNFARYRNNPIYDTMREWERWGQDFIALDTLAKILGLESSKKELDGSKVYEYFLQGKLEEIYQYCKADVEVVKKVYKKINFLG